MGWRVILCVGLALGFALGCGAPRADGAPPAVDTAAEDGPAAEAARRAILPPELPWEGRSLELVAAADDPWITPAEATGFARTPSYEETVAWLRRLVAAVPQLALVPLGESPEGRTIWMVVASREGAATPAALAANGRPTLLAQAGIHAGEIDGKDAGLMLLRDLTVSGARAGLLAGANLLFVPILNVDGHERSSPYSRMNQRGPEVMGWRTTARNLNLNRDYAKLDTPELRALVAALDAWRPDLYLDLHVTDGADYQYDVTYGFNGVHAWSPAIAGWLGGALVPALERDLRAAGHVPGPLVFHVAPLDPARGIVDWTAGIRFSNGYGDARHLATLLVENHSLKPYRQRVLGTYVLLASSLEALAAGAGELEAAVARDRARRPAEVPLAFGPGGERRSIEFLGVSWRRMPSKISGVERVEWTGRPEAVEMPLHPMTAVTAAARRPRAFWVPPAWGEVIERLAAHGIRGERSAEAQELTVEMYRLEEVSYEPEPFEGHLRVRATPLAERRRVTLPAGSLRVPTDQPLGELAMLLLEPASPDSFFQWGFFLEVLQRTEYAEPYVLEPMAEAMLAADPALAAAFRRRLAADPDFAADPEQRREWFYRRTPFWDERFGLYPVAREVD